MAVACWRSSSSSNLYGLGLKGPALLIPLFLIACELPQSQVSTTLKRDPATLLSSQTSPSPSPSPSVTVSPSPSPTQTQAPINQAPTVQAGANQSVTLPAQALLSGVASDDGLPNPPARLTFSWLKLSGPGGVSFANPSSLQTSASFTSAGIYWLELQASDGALTASSQMMVSVSLPAPLNQAPVVSAGLDQSITLPSQAQLQAQATDDGLPSPPGALSVQWSQLSGPGVASFAQPTQLSTSVSFSQPGTYVLRLQASDSLLTAQDTVSIIVSPVPPQNQRPQVSVGSSQSITLPAQASLTAQATDDGLPSPPGVMTYQWSKLSGPGNVTFTNSQALLTQAAFSQAGSYVLQLLASDSLLSASTQVTITVNAAPPVNQTPVVNAGSDQGIALSAQASLQAIASDDGLPSPPGALSYQWSKLSGPGSVTFTSSQSLSTQASFSLPGVYVLQVSANDSLLSSSDSITITVNQAPSVNAGIDQALSVTAQSQLLATASDDGLPSPPGVMTYQWSRLSGPGTVTFSAATSKATQASFSVAGTYVLQFTASDSVLSSSDTLTVTVSPAPPVNVAPTVFAGADQSITLPAQASLSGNAVDDGLPQGSSIQYTWSKVSGPGTVTFSTSTQTSTQATFAFAGNYVVRLTASDGSLSGSDDLAVTVSAAPPVNAPPKVTLASALSVTLPASATLSATVTDDGLPNPPAKLTYGWAKVSGPGTVTFSAPAALTTSATFSIHGSYVISFMATDGAATDTKSTAVTVAPASSAVGTQVPPGANLQTYIDQAIPGETLLLQAGATYKGNFLLRNKATTSTQYITITTSDFAKLPPGNERIDPVLHAAHLARVVSSTGTSVFRTEAGAHHYKLIGLEISSESPSVIVTDVVSLGSTSETNIAQVPHHLVIDRCYIHGWPGQNSRKGIYLNSASTDVLNSYISEIHHDIQDSQGIGGINGPGPFNIINNHIEGSAENIMLGGGTSAIVGLVPTGIVVRKNHLIKPLSLKNWKKDIAQWNLICKPIKVANGTLPDDPRCARFAYGTAPSNYADFFMVINPGAYTAVIKNLFELKNAQDVLVEDNILENNWVQADQHGTAVVLTPRVEKCAMPWAVVQRVTFRRNIIRNSGGLLLALGKDQACQTSPRSNSITFQNNLIYDLRNEIAFQTSRIIQFIGTDNLVFDRNHILHGADSAIYGRNYFMSGAISQVDTAPNAGYRYSCNITNYVAGISGVTTLASPVFDSNVIIAASTQNVPGNNSYAASEASVGFVDAARGDYTLGPSSPYGSTCNGSPAGADVLSIMNATSTVVDGH